MEFSQLLSRLNAHTVAIYENEIEEVSENGRIVNWFLGLAGGALLFSFSQLEADKTIDFWIILFQAIVFVLVILTGLAHRFFTKSFRSYTVAMIRMFDLLSIEFELIPEDLKEDLENGRIIAVFGDYLNGEYFDESDRDLFDKMGKKQIRSYGITRGLTVFAILLVIAQFGSFFFAIF
jgi:hypothetical protein